MVPAKPRKSWLGRLTHCTGRRKPIAPPCCSTSTLSRYSSTLWPRYQGVCGERSSRLSPCSADSGMAVTWANAELFGQFAITGLDFVEHRLVVADQVHLVHRQQHVADAQQRHDVAVAARLSQQALARVDQHHGDVSRGRAGGHVAGVLLVARAVGDDELALVGAEEAVGDIDGDALLALGGEAIEQQRVIDVVALGAVATAVAVQRGELVVEQALAFVQQAADQRALAVVDAAAGDEAQQPLGLVLVQVGGDGGRGVLGGGNRAGSSEVALLLLLLHRRGSDRGRSRVPAVRKWSPPASRR